MSTNSNSSFGLTTTTVQDIIKKKLIVRANQAGETVRFHIQGNGNTIPVKDKTGMQVMASGTDNVPLMKTIYGTKVNSHIAMLNPRNQELLKQAVETEKDGDAQATNAAFNAYLNKIQANFSVIMRPNSPKFYNQQLVEGEVEIITTENGQLITFTNVRPVVSEKLKSTGEFSLADLMGLGEAPKAEDVFEAIEATTTQTPATEAVVK